MKHTANNELNDRSVITRFALGCLCAAIILAPLGLGATTVWARYALEATASVACFLATLTSRGSRRVIALPLLALVLCALQQTPLPMGLLLRIAPASANAWLADAERLPQLGGTISVAPQATTAACVRLFLGLTILCIVAERAKSMPYRRWLGVSLATSGILVWAVGITFPVTFNDRIVMGFVDLKGPIESWKNPVNAPVETNGVGYLDWVSVGAKRYQMDAGIIGDGFGPYICSNHFANALCFTLPFILALTVQLASPRIPRLAVAGLVTSLIAAATWTCGILAQSRAGSAAVLFAGMTFLTLTTQGKWAKRALATTTGFLACGILGLAVILYGKIEGVAGFFPERWQARVSSLNDDARAAATTVAFRIFKASPILGTGLGTYDSLFPSYLSNNFAFYFAHNDYAQFLAEAGVGGALLVVAVLAVLLYQRRRSQPELSSLHCDVFDAAAWAAVSGFVVHSLFDWNLHVPANAFLASIVTGLALARTPMQCQLPAGSRDRPSLAGSFRVDFVKCIVAVACVWTLLIATREAASERVQQRLRRVLVATVIATTKGESKGESRFPSAELEAAAASGSRMLAWDPANARLAVLVGQAYEHLSAQTSAPELKAKAEATAASLIRQARRHAAVVRGVPE